MIPVFRPSLDTEAVLRELRPVLEGGWLGMGAKVEELESALAKYVGAKHFIATSSCTAALHLAVKVIDLPWGSSILTSPITFVSTNAAILYEGLLPVFGRVDGDGQLDESPRVNRTIATISVHLGGARCRSKAEIEDCAHAFGAPWIKEPHNSLMRCWSFHAVKNLPMGDGGGISTDDDDIAARLRRLRWMGITKSTFARSANGYVTDYDIPELGYKYHMNDITAAIGLATLPLVEAHNMRRQQIATQYAAAFPEAAPSYSPEVSSCHFYPLFFDNRAEVEERLQKAGIGYSRHYKPNFLFAPMRNFQAPGRGSAMRYYERALVLPIFPSMTDEQVHTVIETVQTAKGVEND